MSITPDHQPTPSPRPTFWRSLLTLLLIFLVAACGGSNDDTASPGIDEVTFATATPQATPSPRPTEASAALTLSSNFTRTDGAIRVAYPNGWEVSTAGESSSGTLSIATTPSALRGTIDDDQDFFLRLEWAPATAFGAAPDSLDFDLVALLNQIRGDAGAAPFELAEGVIAARHDRKDDGLQSSQILLDLGSGVLALAEVRRYGDFEATLLALLNSLQYAGPVVVATQDETLADPLYVFESEGEQSVWGAFFSPDGSQLFYIYDSGNLVSTSMNDPTQRAVYENDARIIKASASSDNQSVFLLVEGSDIVQLERQSLALQQAFRPPIGRLVAYVLSPDESLIAGIVINNQNFNVPIWEVSSGELLDTFRPSAGSSVNGLRWSHAGDLIYLYGSGEEGRVYRIADGEWLMTTLHTAEIVGGIFSADDSRLISFGRDGYAIMWSLLSGNAIMRFEHPTGIPRGARLNRDESQLLTWQPDRLVTLWDSSTGEIIYQFETPNAMGNAFWSPDESSIISVTNPATTIQQVHTVNASDGSTIARYRDENLIGESGLAPDGSALLTWRDNRAILRSFPAGTIIFQIEHEAISGARFSPDGSYIVTWNTSGLVQVTDLVASSEE